MMWEVAVSSVSLDHTCFLSVFHRDVQLGYSVDPSKKEFYSSADSPPICPASETNTVVSVHS